MPKRKEDEGATTDDGHSDEDEKAELPMVGLTLTNSSSHSRGGHTQLLVNTDVDKKGATHDVVTQPSNETTPKAKNEEVGVMRITSVSMSSKKGDLDPNEVAL